MGKAKRPTCGLDKSLGLYPWARRSRLSPPYDNALFLFDRHAVGAEIDPHALGLLAVLIELKTQDDDNNHQCADDEVDDIAATYVSISVAEC